MTLAQVDIRRAALGEHDLVGRALAAAFADDPVFTWLVPSSVAERARRLDAFFTAMARSYLRRDKHVDLAGGGAGAAMWAAPGSWALPISEAIREARPAFTAFGRRLPWALRLQFSVEAKHPKQPAHWYLGYLGVGPGHQGQGIGAALLRQVLESEAARGVPAYLESSNERNLTLYERHGFRVVESFPALGHGPTIWRMLREGR
jgi:ribosomal protein S18 acetylase RimI-like enzyme